MKRITSIFLFFLLLLVPFHSKASHIIGGEIYYDYIGNNKYKVYIAVYRDCATINGAAYDNPLSLAIYTSTNTLVRNVQINFPGSTVLPILFNNPCIVAPSGFCNEKAVYTTTVELPPRPGGYILSYQRCCRRPDVINIRNPGDTGLTLTCRIPGSENNNYMNSSPRFTNYPPLVLCNNDVLRFDHSATEPDGDQLVYELITPLSGATDLAPMPSPSPPPPYAPVVWGNTFSESNPFGPGASININSTTGALEAAPLRLGMFVVGVRVKEYRNGVLISQTDRDFIFKVINCNITLDAKITPQNQMNTFVSYCEGLTITFENQSYGARSYLWDFGVPGIDTDISTATTPTYTFPAPGTYVVTLIANPGWPCTDTSIQVFEVNEHLTVDFTHTDSLCLSNNSFDFQGTFQGPSGTQLSWDFGNSATPSSATGTQVNNVNFNRSGSIPVTLTGTFSTCTKTKTKNVFIYPEPTANFDFLQDHLCKGLTQTFRNTSGSNVNSSWDFGVPGITTDVSSDEHPTYTYPSGGNYDVTLIVSYGGRCKDTLIRQIEVAEPIELAFTHNDSLCVTNNSFSFDGTVSGPPGTIYSWDFGGNATPSSHTGTDITGVQFSSAGTFPISFTGAYKTCVKTVTSSVRIFDVPSIDFMIADELRCAPYPAHFINLSTTDGSPVYYTWDFGDGTQSSLTHPDHVYTNPGIYNVTLKLITTAGCKDTLSLYKPDFINVRPSPVSSFSVNPLITDICHSDVTFTDASSGATSYLYYFDDYNFYSREQNPVHTYKSSGQKYPVQIVTNQYGCKDTSRAQLYIQPFTVYIPNAFTPDQNELNNTFNAVISLEVHEWDFKIYNRWGELVFKTEDPGTAWDGTYNGYLCPDGLYTYVLRYHSCEDIDKENLVTGHVSLLK